MDPILVTAAIFKKQRTKIRVKIKEKKKEVEKQKQEVEKQEEKDKPTSEEFPEFYRPGTHIKVNIELSEDQEW